MTHNFKLVIKHPQGTVYENIWHCDNCDSSVAYPVELKQFDVNKLMSLRMACVAAKEFFTN